MRRPARSVNPGPSRQRAGKGVAARDRLIVLSPELAGNADC